MGRPPGARNGGVRRRDPPDWELRDPRFEEIYSDEEEEDARGVLLAPRARRSRMSGDHYFDRRDVGRNRISRGGIYDLYGDEFDISEMDEEGEAHQAAIREKEDALIHSALGRIARARAKGRNNVNLSEEEMEALERRRDPQPEPPRPALASPPPTPAKSSAKAKGASRSNSTSNLASKARKRNSGLFGGSSSPAKSSSKARASASASVSRRGSLSPPNGMMLQGPIGAPVYAPIAYHGHGPEYPPAPRPSSKSVSRSASRQRRRQSTPPERQEMYASYPPPYYYPAPRMRPDSAGSQRSLPDDVDWAPPPGPRHRSTSNVQYTGYHTDYDAAAGMPAAQGRRNISGPPDVRYSQLRRVPPMSTALATRPPNKHSSQSDPAIRKGSGLSQEIADSASSSSSTSEEEDDDDEGVQVDIVPHTGNGMRYSGSRAALPTLPPASGNEGRKRRSGRK